MNERDNQEAERAAPCPLCNTDRVQICRDSNNPMKDTARCRECKCTGPLAIWNQRRAPAVGEDGLPPLPAPRVHASGDAFGAPSAYTAEQYRQGQRDAKAFGYALGRGDAVRDYISPPNAQHPASAAQGVKRWQERAHEMDGPHKRLELECQQIADLRAQLASERQAKEYEQRHAAESENALAQLQAQLARKSQDADRYQLARAQLVSNKFPYYSVQGEQESLIDEYCDAELAKLGGAATQRLGAPQAGKEDA